MQHPQIKHLIVQQKRLGLLVRLVREPFLEATTAKMRFEADPTKSSSPINRTFILLPVAFCAGDPGGLFRQALIHGFPLVLRCPFVFARLEWPAPGWRNGRR